jgi:HEAT repeat protein
MNGRDAEAELRDNLDLLGSEHGDYKHAVHWFVARGPSAVAFLIDALQNEASTSLRRARIVETLGEIRDEAAVPSLKNLLLLDKELGWETAQALGRIGTPAAEEALIGCLRDPRLALVKECTKALGVLHSPRATAALQAQMKHADPSVRYYAIQSLIQARAPGLEEILRAHLVLERDPEVRRLIESWLRDPRG